MKNFWLSLPRPFTVLAPMDGVTDVVFRQMIADIGKPDVFFTEFTNVDGLNSSGSEKVKESLKFDKNQFPVIAHLWGKNPDAFLKSAKMCEDMGFAGIDINMGCPDRVIVKMESCAALIKNPDLAQKIIFQTKMGAGDLPVSVKTRLGYSEKDLNWIKFLLEQDLDAITIHLRTVAEMSKPSAHWDVMPEIIKLRDEISQKTLIIGNGDIKTFREIDEKYETYHCEGFMVGRGIFQNPWLFNKNIDVNKVAVNERLNLYIKHINLFDKTWKDKNPVILKKFCKAYINNFPDASDLRVKIMECSNTSEMLEVLNTYNKSQ